MEYKFIIGEKEGMTTFFNDDEAIPATIIKIGPCVVTNLKLKEKDGYSAVQVGYGEKKRVKKPVLGQVHNLGKFKVIKEFRLPEDPKEINIGDQITVDIFNVGDKVDVTGISKGRGFQGVVKRWGFRDGPKTHGQTTKMRHPGSIGATTPQRVIKGHKMAGRMGGERIVVRNLEILDIDKENNLILVKGSIPGNKKTIVEIRSSNLTRKGKRR
ncbi:MAG: 50S ribosomal protein L3 [Minisyncoccia bacterium]